MKKIIIFIVIVCLSILILTSCRSTTVIYEDEPTFNENFRMIKETMGGKYGDNFLYLYDINTNIIYLYTYCGNRATMCPYYVIVNGEPTIAIYGVNYEN